MDDDDEKTVLAFDIGIKNLAWCCVRKTGTIYTILGWDNYNLLEEESAARPPTECGMCKSKAIYTCGGPGTVRCGRHIPAGFEQFKDSKGKPAKKIPPVGTLKKLVGSLPSAKKPLPAGKDALLAALAHCYAIPIVEKKVVRNMDANLTALHDSITRLVEERRELWSKCDVICLENQPAFKNPTMKSVQMLLFATLRNLYGPTPPPLRLVHAKKKVEGVEKGDKGYKARKDGGEARAAQFLHGSGLVGGAPWLRLWNGAKKKSDLADGLCMCLDQLC
jgi:hypothetical protein